MLTRRSVSTLGGNNLVVGHLNRPGIVAREPSLGYLDPAVDPLVDQEAIGKEDVGLVVIEVVADLTHIPRRATDDLGQLLATNTFELLAVGVGFAAVDESIVLLFGRLVERVGRRVEVGLEAQHTDVFVSTVGAAAEDVDDRVFLAATPLDGVIDLRDHEFDRAGRVGELRVVNVDDLADPTAAVAGDDRGRIASVASVASVVGLVGRRKR